MYTPPVTPWELVIPEAGSLTCLQEGAIEGRISDWGEVVTRYPYGNVGMDHLLSKEKASVEILFSFEWTLLRETQEEIIENWIIEKRKREDRDKEISRSF